MKTCRADAAADPLDKRRRERTRAYYEQNYPAAKVMLIGMQLERGDRDVALADLGKAADVPVPTAQFLYNYACAWPSICPRKVTRSSRPRAAAPAAGRAV